VNEEETKMDIERHGILAQIDQQLEQAGTGKSKL